MKEVITGTMKSSKENFNMINSRKNSISFNKLIKIIKLKKRVKK